MATEIENKIWEIVKGIFAEPDFLGYRLTRTFEVPKELSGGFIKPEDAWPTCLINYDDSDGTPHEVSYQKPISHSWQDAEVEIRRLLTAR
jgi:hypothetical protein